MLRLIEDLIAETGKSVILCTHLLGDVEQLCQQIVVLHKGTVVRSGTMAAIKANGSNVYELGWLGEDAGFLDSLRRAGVEVSGLPAVGKAIVTTPAGWTTLKFFELARDRGVVLTHMKPDEEDLHRAFLRVTDEHANLQQGQA
jgi:ABC-2 type transport system ATP-binding protein